MWIRPKKQNWILNRQHFPGAVSDCIGHAWCQQKQTFSSSGWWWSNDRIRKLPGARDKQRRQRAALQSRSLQQKYRGKDHCLSKLFCVCVFFVLTRSYNSLLHLSVSRHAKNHKCRKYLLLWRLLSFPAMAFTGDLQFLRRCSLGPAGHVPWSWWRKRENSPLGRYGSLLPLFPSLRDI